MIEPRKEHRAKGDVWVAHGVSAGRDPVTGKRIQRTVTADTKKAAEAEIRAITETARRSGHARRSRETISDLVASFLASGEGEWEKGTSWAYAMALRPAVRFFGDRQAADLRREDIEDYKRHQLTTGRTCGGEPGTGLRPVTVKANIDRLSAVFDLAERDGKLAANPCKWVKRPRVTGREHATWEPAQVAQFLAVAARDRLHACWLLSLLGLRRGEVCGLRWRDVSLADGTITVARTRTTVGHQVVEKGPKSRRSGRTLPLFEPLTSALSALYARQCAERDQLGVAYRCPVDDGWVCADEDGEPWHPDLYSAWFSLLRSQAGVPPIRLHDCRASVNSHLERLGVPDTIRAAWLGHTVAENRGSYLAPARVADLAPLGEQLGRFLGEAM